MKWKFAIGFMLLIGWITLFDEAAWAGKVSSPFVLATSSSSDSSSASTSSSATCGGSFLGFYPWYYGLTYSDTDCDINGPSSTDELAPFVWTIALNVLADLVLAIGYIAIAFVLYGGFLFITAQDDPGRVAKARKTLTYAIVGTIIGILASNIVHAVVNAL